ncbi:MobF family relaxase [Candidatus Binatus sp.]|uniref:MobF family relaxase n=1 Tax=Candidatus Binatus sp. TaxID=2811406 RepID=UPI003CC514A0
MLVMSRGALSAGQAETYYEEKYSQDDYYTEEHRVAGQWFGQGADALGLTGEVAPEDFRAILRGQRPDTAEVLVRNANGRTERRAGWDATFNAPKSVSIQALAGADAALTDAHRRAVSRALTELEHYALSRQKGGSEWVLTRNIVAARFDHIAARPAKGADDGYGPDPHLHTHVVIANMTRRPDGAWRGLDPVEIYRSQSFASAVYRSELAREVRSLGYDIKVTGADGRWELEGYSREQVMAFSRRRQDIEQALARNGLSGAAAAQNIAHQSRLSKQPYDEGELREEWRARAQNQEIRLERPSRAHAAQVANTAKIGEALRFAVAHSTEREAVIDRRVLEATALQHAMGAIDLDKLRRESTAWEQRRALIAVDASISSPNGTFTTPEMVALERDNLDLMGAGRKQNPPIAAAEEIRRWATDRGLLPDQIEVAQLLFTTPDWLTSIEGRAGSAKTTTVGAIREFAEEHGYAVRGFAPTTRAVKALSEAGVESRTVASLLENKIPEAGRHEVWIVDESSLLATRQVNRLLHRAREASVERIVFVGDQHQHHAIEAGRPIHQMQQAGMPVARLDTIRRQRDPMLRAAVELAAKEEIDRALALLEQHDRIREIENPDVRYKSIAREYVAAHEAGERVLVVSPANDERRQLNSAIRQLLVRRFHIRAEGKEQVIFVNRDLTAAQRQHPQSYEVGDVVRYRRGSRRLGLGKGTYARVQNTDSDLNRITVRTEDGRAMEYNPARLTGVDLFREERRLIANGDRIQFHARDRALGVVNGEFATVVAIDDRKAALRMDDGREVKAAVSRLRHIDYGYASTSHSSQGATVDRVIVNIDTARSAELVNRKQFYVSISRARHNATIYTDDRAALQHAVGRTREKSIAVERLNLNVGRDIKMVSEPARQRITPAHGIRR